MSKNERNIKVLHIIENFSDDYGGPSKSLPQLCNSLREFKTESSVYTVEYTHNELCRYYDIKVTAFKNFLFRYFSPKLLIRLYEESKLNNFDIFHFHSIWSSPTWFGLAFCFLNNKKYVISPRSSLYKKSLERKSFFKNILLRLFLKKLISRAAFIHTTEPVESSDVKALCSGKVFELPHGIIKKCDVNLEQEEPSPQLKGLSFSESKSFVFLSRIHPRKRLKEVILSFLNLDMSKGYKLFIAGPKENNEYFNECLDLVPNELIGESVFYLGMLSSRDVEFILSRSDFFVVPSDFENFGLAIIEALGNHLFVIIGRHTPWQDVSDYGIGICCEPSVPDISNAMRKALLNYDKKNMEQQTKLYLEKRACSWNSVGKKMSAQYLRVLGVPL